MLFKSISDAVVIVNMKGDILECNQAHIDMTGYSQKELFSMTCQELTPEKWHAFEASIVAEQIIPHGHSSSYEMEYKRKDGTIMPVELQTFLIRDTPGNPSQMCSIVRDISARKASEVMLLEWNRSLERRVAERTSALKQSKARFKQLAETTFEGILISDNGIITDGNTLSASMFGYDLKELIGKPIGDLAAPCSKESVSGEFLSDKDVSTGLVALRSDGTTFPVEAHARTTAHQKRKVRIIAIRDLTSAKAAESRISAQQAQLNEVQRLALISEIAAGTIHQVGQPLTSMAAKVMATISGLESCKNVPCRLIGYLRDVEADIGRMRDIVIHMRSLGDHEKAERKTCDLNQIIKNVIPILNTPTRRGGIELKFIPHSDLPQVNADAVQLSQVVLNLVKNAQEACAGQGTQRKFVNILTNVVGRKWVEMIVRDEGTGISPDVMARLFTPFFSTKPDGIGVGLRLCRTVIEAHDGTITCFNNVDGTGATFQVRLPALSAPDAAGK